MKEIQRALQQGHYVLDMKARNLRSLFHQVLNFLVAQELLPLDQRESVEQALLAREQEASTAVGHATALPHAYLPGLKQPVVAFVRLARPLNLGALDGVPTQYFFIMLGPTDHAAQHLETLMNIARLVSDDQVRYELGAARNRQDLLDAFAHFQARNAPPPEDKPTPIPEELHYTGKLAGGLMEDLRRKLPTYALDFRDGLNSKALSAILFMFFACLAPSVTFGGLMAAGTNSHIGVVEMIAATALCGIVFALFSGQPLLLLGGTGPMLVFTLTLYGLCAEFKIPFLPAYAWTGLWTAVILLIMALTDASVFMRLFTRFTDEVFAALISSIFIFESIRRLIDVFQGGGGNPERNHDIAFLTLIIALGTFFFALNLSRFNRSRYLMPKLRLLLADFGPMIAIGVMTVVAMSFDDRVSLPALDVPESFSPTLIVNEKTGEQRAWLVNLFPTAEDLGPKEQFPGWMKFAMFGPALLASVLIYLDQNITARLINSADHKLQRGGGYNLDLTVVSVLTAICSLFGLPWLVAATVRSLNHVRSLATVEEAVDAEGDTREHIVHVRENRLSGLGIHVLIGLSLLLLPLLQNIPMAVLYGIFLYMGVVSMKGNQFFERISLWPMDSSLYPSTHYMRRVPISKIHLFTLIQLLCLITLWLVKSGPPFVGIFFPLFIALLVPVRLFISRFFTSEELAVLDAEETPDEETTDWGSG